MDNKKILIVNLSKGKVGEGNANLLGSLLITKIYLAAMSRADVDIYTQEKLPPFYFYVDEFQNFANESFSHILSEARKYKLALTVAHQYIEQMTDEVKAAVFGNVGTMITFRVGATDAEVFEKEFAPFFILDDFVNLSAYQIYVRLMIDNQGSKPFSARTLDPILQPMHSYAQAVIASSRATYGRPKFAVEDEIMEFYKPVPKPERKKEVPAPLPGERHLSVGDAKVEQKGPFDPTRKRDETRHVETERRPVHTAPQRRNDEKRRDTREQAQKTEQTHSAHNKEQAKFDDRPAVSLKEALAKALREQNGIPDENQSSLHKKDSAVKSGDTGGEKKAKEVPEEVLRKLLGEE